MSAADSNTLARTPWVMVLLVLVFVVYPVSVGPTLWFVGEMNVGPLYDAYDIFYKPLYLLQGLRIDDGVVKDC